MGLSINLKHPCGSSPWEPKHWPIARSYSWTWPDFYFVPGVGALFSGVCLRAQIQKNQQEHTFWDGCSIYIEWNMCFFDPQIHTRSQCGYIQQRGIPSIRQFDANDLMYVHLHIYIYICKYFVYIYLYLQNIYIFTEYIYIYIYRIYIYIYVIHTYCNSVQSGEKDEKHLGFFGVQTGAGFYLLGYGAFYQTLLDLPQHALPQRGAGPRGTSSLPSMLRDSWEKALTEHMESGMHRLCGKFSAVYVLIYNTYWSRLIGEIAMVFGKLFFFKSACVCDCIFY